MKKFKGLLIACLTLLVIVSGIPSVQALDEPTDHQIEHVLDENDTNEGEEVMDQGENEVTPVDTSSISRFEIYASSRETEFFNGQEILAYIGFATSESSGSLSNLVIELDFPEEFLESAPILSTADSIDGQPEIELVDGVYKIKYNLNPLLGGSNIDIPFKFKFKVNHTHHGATIPITGVIKNNNGVVVANDEISYVNINKDLKVDKGIQGSFSNSNLSTSYTDGNTIYAGELDENDETILTDDISKLKPVKFNYRIPSVANTNVGNRYYKTFTIEDTLPQGAIFREQDNPGWTYDPSTRIAKKVTTLSTSPLLGYSTYTASSSTNASINQVLTLYFPNGELNKDYVNNIKLTLTPTMKHENEEDLVLTDDITFRLTNNVITEPSEPRLPSISKSGFGTSVYYDIPTSKENFDLNSGWNISLTNRSIKNRDMEDIILEDHSLNPALYFTKGVTRITDETAFIGTVNIYAINSSDEKIMLLENVSLSESHEFELGKDIVSVFIETTKGSVLKANGQISVQLFNKIRDHSQTTSSTVRLYNYLRGTAKYVDSNEPGTVTTSSYKTHYPYAPSAYISKNVQNKSISYFVGDSVTYQLNALIGSLAVEDTVEMNKIVDLIPNGLTYVPNSSKRTFPNLSRFDQNLDDFDVEPTIVYNYKGTGKTALIWNLGDITSKIFSSSSYAAVRYTYQLEVTKYADTGANLNRAYLAWDNNDIIRVNVGTTLDEFDLNNNGSTTDFVSSSSEFINYVPPRELLTTKTVKGGLDDVFMSEPNIAMSEIDSDIYYKLNIFNNSTMDYRKLDVVDILPHVGDKRTSIDFGEDVQEQLKRNSQFRVGLSGPITLPEGYAVTYALEVPHYDNDDFINSVEWFDTVEDYGLVRAVKFSLIEGHTLSKDSTVTFDITARVEKDYSLDDGVLITNSFGTSTGSVFGSFESNDATLGVVTYKVVGTVFNDFNEDGLHNEVDIFDQHLVQLVYEDGTPVYDLEGELIQMLTDDKGYYEFDVYRQGNYRIKVLDPHGYDLVRKTAGDDQGSHIENDTTTTAVFSLNPQNRFELRNAGYYKNDTTLHLTKELKNIDGEDILSDVSFEFTLKIAGSLYEGPATIDGVDVEIKNGLVYLKGGSTLIVTGLDKDVAYEVIETADDAYLVSPSDRKLEGDLSSQDIYLLFTNVFQVQYEDITVDKVWLGGPVNRPDITVQLLQNGEAYGEPVVIKSGTLSYTWKQVPKTDINGLVYEYSVEEIDVPEGYTSTVEGFTITNTFIEVPKEEPTEGPKLPSTGVSTVLPVAGILSLALGILVFEVSRRKRQFQD